MDSIADFCRAHAFPDSIAVAWRARGIAGWTALQEAAWREGLPGGAEHWLVAAPTSAGKGLVAEAAAIATLLGGRKVLWLAPTRVLAAAAARQFESTLAGLGLCVRCATHDTAGEDAAIFAGRFDLLVAVYEKAAAWVLRQPHGLAEVGLVVADELTTLRDPERGARLDTLLTLIQSSPYSPRRLGLAMPVSNIDDLARWWGGRLLLSRERPRPLREGVLGLLSGRLRWRDRDTGAEGTETLTGRGTLARWIARARNSLDEADWPPLSASTAAVAGGLAARGEPTILFASSRARARHWARGVGEAFSLKKPGAQLIRQAQRLAERDPAFDHQLLARLLERGVGLHHADLSPEGRRLVEEAYADGQINLLVATPTLAQGVNLAAVNVVHWPERAESPAASGGWRRAPLERWRFADQGGRAGRLGLGEGPGRSILAAWDERQEAELWRRYVLEEPEPIESGLAGGSLCGALLTCLAGDVARTHANVMEFFDGSFAGATAWRERPQELAAGLNAAIECSKKADLVEEFAGLGVPPSGGIPIREFRLTGLGQACAALGIEPETSARLRIWTEEESQHPCHAEPLPALCALALCAPPGLWPVQSRAGRSPIAGELRRWFMARELTPPRPLAALLERPGGPGAGELAALEAAWRLSLWIGPDPSDQVERRTGWPAGALARAGEGLARVAGAAAALVLAGGGRAAAAEGWLALAPRLAAGVTTEGTALAGLRIDGLSRGAIQALCVAGLGSPRALVAASTAALAHTLADKCLARQLRAAARACMAKQEMRIGTEMMFGVEFGKNIERTEVTERAVRAVREEFEYEHEKENEQDGRDENPLIEIDLQSPGVVRVAGRELRLAPLSFDLLAALAESPGRVLTRAAIYQRLWPEGGPEEQQLDAHRRRLTDELGGALGRPAGGVVEIVRGVGFRLNLPERRVQLQRG